MRGSRVGPYMLLAEIGSGGMGTVYLAHDEEEERAVAVKVMHARLSDAAGFFRRFEREAEAGMRVSNPHVVRTLDFGLHAAGETTVCYLVTEFVEGRTLRDVLRELGTLPEALVREIAQQIARGLAAIHAAGIVHRDLKPDNVLITGDEQVRIMDLGVAKVLDATRSLTQQGQFAGSLAYAAPEQFGGLPDETLAERETGTGSGGAIDGRADLYSLGLTIHELLTGRNPMARADGAATVRAQLDETPPDVSDALPDVSPFLAELVRTLAAKRPAARIASAEALAGILIDGEDSAWWNSRRDDRARRTASVPRVPVQRETALCGRDADLAVLAQAWESACSGDGGTVLIEGEAGIGKSRLADALLSTVAARGGHALYGSFAPGGGGDGLADAVVSRFDGARLEAALERHLAATPDLLPAFAAHLRGGDLPSGRTPLSRDALHAAWSQLLRGLASEQPLVWVVEDLHFAPTEARRIVLSLARAARGRRALLVLTTRTRLTDSEAGRFEAAGWFRRARPERLGPSDVGRLLRDAFRSERLVQRLSAHVAEKSDGVPLFVCETIRGLKAGRYVVPLEDGTWAEAKPIDRIGVPPSVRDAIAARLAEVPARARDLLDAAAVQGYEFDPDLAADVLRRAPLDVLQALARLERESGVVRAADRRYRFDHHQIQEVLYADMQPRLREEYHASIAEALERRCGAGADPSRTDGATCAELAEHFVAGARGSRALAHLDAALTYLESRYANDRAVELADRVLAVPGLVEGTERAALLIRKASRLDVLSRRDAQRTALEEAASLADRSGDVALRARTRQLLAACALAAHRYADAERFCSEALPLAREAGAAVTESIVTAYLGHIDYFAGRFTEASARYQRALELAKHCGDVRRETQAIGSLGNVLSALGRPGDALEQFRRALELARASGDLAAESDALDHVGSMLNELGRPEEAAATHEEALRIARSAGYRAGEQVASDHLAAAWHVQGRLAEALDLAHRCVELAGDLGDPLHETVALAGRGSILRKLGDLDAARADLETVLRRLEGTPNPYIQSSVLLDLAAVDADGGDDAGALRRIDASLGLRRRTGQRDGEADALIARGESLARLARGGEARSDLEAALAIAREVALPPVELAAAAALAAVTGDARDALAVLPHAEAGTELTIRASVRLALWRATGDRAHVAEAKRHLDFLLEHAPPGRRAAMLANVSLHRAIDRACGEAGR